MAATNALIHLLALAGLLGLALALLRSQKQKEFLLALLLPQPGESERVRVDWPLRFVRKFANACAIPFYGPLLAKGGAPRRIKGQALAALLTREGIAYLKWQERSPAEGREAYLEVGVQRGEGSLADLSQALSMALQLPVHVVAARRDEVPGEVLPSR